ncbi:S1C family serine protease [Falsiroseomonas ponticola]|uniref:S1C family serine protease n=1 Tax=Falsiroseomonas ponticola TaxID=2786951 RepID=UPI001933FF71|nr:trypsin-like peptidase domain-containing protein [Roseomonas ponticola]
MRNISSVILLSLSLAVPAAAQAPAPPQGTSQAEPVRIVNRTGQEATALHAVRSGRPDWGSNLLNRGPLPTNAAFPLRVNQDAGCRFDIRLVLADGREGLLRDRDICAEARIEITTASAPLPPVAQARPNQNARRVSSGTGFVVAPDRVLTNHHVIDGCGRILARTADGRWLAATVQGQADARLDLALLAVPGNPGPTLAFRAAPAVRRGEGVVAYGFPLSGLLSSDPKLTRGEINAFGGVANDQTRFQISAEVQPGNSGGPLLDMQGNVVGVVVAKLDNRRVQNVDNVNFAVKGETAQAFLRRNNQEFRTAESRGAEKSAADVGDIAHRATVMLRCEP